MGAPSALAVRVVLVGLERVLLRRMSQGAEATECAAAFFGVAVLVLLPFAGLQDIRDWSFLWLAVPSGLIYAVAYWLYVAALTGADVSAVAPLSSTSTVFVVVLAAIVHGEALAPLKVSGALLISGGAVFLQWKARGSADSVPPRAVAAMLAYAFLTAVTRMLDKAHASMATAPPGAYALCVFGVVALCHLALLVLTGRWSRLGALVRREPLAVLAAGVCNGGSFLLLLIAMVSLPVSIAEPVTSLSLLVSAGLAAVWFREPAGARLVPTVAMIIGTWMLIGGGGPNAGV